jgi:hypothetical protein
VLRVFEAGNRRRRLACQFFAGLDVTVPAPTAPKKIPSIGGNRGDINPRARYAVTCQRLTK